MHDDRTMIRLILASSVIAATSLLVAPTANAVELTPAQLTDAGFPKKPNTTSWGGTAALSTDRAAAWQDVIITGRAADFTQPGQVLTMQRFVPSDTQGSGSFRDLAIATTVNPNRTFTLHFQLGTPGTFGYRVGYVTDTANPEFVGFQFQFTTTGSGAAAPSTGSATPVTLTSRQLARAGFTRTPNVVGWGGTAQLSASRVAPGQSVTVTGTAPPVAKRGQVLQLKSFVATDRRGSGHFDDAGITTKVRKNGTFTLTFTPTGAGSTGYTLGFPGQFEWLGVEFQVTVR
jgi:hypothetical protein